MPGGFPSFARKRRFAGHGPALPIKVEVRGCCQAVIPATPQRPSATADGVRLMPCASCCRLPSSWLLSGYSAICA